MNAVVIRQAPTFAFCRENVGQALRQVAVLDTRAAESGGPRALTDLESKTRQAVTAARQALGDCLAACEHADVDDPRYLRG